MWLHLHRGRAAGIHVTARCWLRRGQRRLRHICWPAPSLATTTPGPAIRAAARHLLL